MQKIAQDFTFRSEMKQLIRCPMCGYGRMAIEGIREDNQFVLVCGRCGSRGTARLTVQDAFR